MTLRKIGYAALLAVGTAALVVGSGGTSEAKGKKMAAASPPPPICTWLYQPVCAERGGMKFTYANSCFAQKDGAKGASPGACGAKKVSKKKMKKK